MTKQQENVKTFMKTFGQNTPERPTEMSEADRLLRAKLILEEAFETIRDGLGIDVYYSGTSTVEGFLNNLNNKIVNISHENALLSFCISRPYDEVEFADGLCDIDYVGPCGGAVAAGIDLEPLQNAVHANNMAKLFTVAEIDSLPIDEIGSLVIEKLNIDSDRCYLVKNYSGKVLKPPGFQKVELKSLIEAQKV